MPKKLENPNDILNQRFGKLVIVEYLGSEPDGRNKKHLYRCECDCGKKDVVATRHNLLKGDKTSCGCAHKDAGERRKESLIGQRFGSWLVIDKAPTRYSESGKTRSIMWKCQCDCGTVKDVGARALKTGMSTSCGCVQKNHVSQALTKDLTGQRFGYLTVIERSGSWRPKSGVKRGIRAMWHCRCDCGSECDVIGESLTNGDVTSCGCKKMSKYELYVAQYLESLGYIKNVDYIKEKTFDDFKGVGGQSLRFDFYLKSKSGEIILIECQGEQHFRSTKWFGGDEYLGKLQIHDMLKRDFARTYNYRLIEVPYTKVLYSDIEQFLKENNVC